MKESLMVFGAFTILTLCTLSVNRMAIRSTEQVIDNEVHQVAMTLSQKLMYQITSLSFDEKTVGGKYVLKSDSLTPKHALGRDDLETAVFDDIDDYHGVTIADDSTRYPGFKLNIQVVYADTTNPKNNAPKPTLLKRITITVTNPNYLHDPPALTISSIAGYY